MAQRTDLEKELETTIFRMIEDYPDILKIIVENNKSARCGGEPKESYIMDGYLSIEVFLIEKDFDKWPSVLIKAKTKCDKIIAEINHEYNSPNFVTGIMAKMRYKNIIK